MPNEREQARRDLRWALLFLCGLCLPLAAAIGTTGRPLLGRVALTVVVLVVCDWPLVAAGAGGQGPVGIVQPWRWSAYGFWLGVRGALVALVFVIT